MPSLTVKIVCDGPEEPNWLNACIVELALHTYCENTKFAVDEVVPRIGLPHSLTVKIVYDWPLDRDWMNEGNVAICLHASCTNTKFEVTTVEPWALCEGEESGQAQEIEVS